MLMNELKGKRLLLIGGQGPTADLIDLAHRNQVFIGVLDYNKGTYVKSIADAAHDVSAIDVDAVVQLCKDEHYDGVISNFNDMLSSYVCKIAEKLGFHVPYTVEQLLMSDNKKYFKQTCMKYGVPVPKEYHIASREAIRQTEIEYPVIIKPVDAGGSQGISICHNADELEVGFDKAMARSRGKDVIIEAYIPYDEINVTYIAQDGDIQLAAIHDRYFNITQQGVVRVPDLYIYPSRYTKLFYEKYNDRVIAMLKGIGVKNGSLFMQACVKGDQIYFYESGMRLNGCKTYQILEYENKFNTFERLMSYALTGSMGEHVEFNANFKKWYATWCVVAKPGETIQEYRNLKALESYPWLIHIARRYAPGEKVPDTAAGTLGQLVSRNHICADTKEELIDRLDQMFQLYQVTNPEGESILMQPHDLNSLREKLDYDL
ncbi:MAG: ATP-grasp domain-containing protein [Oscillospiraceae bacterium]|nr:ATP-grasp domain-containing protein [Oscillospiraceae bacterium]